jgi:glyoxylase-like metal-dependent hydrolase (beta-lactamase superfamily II)
VGGRTVDLRYLGRGHTDSDIVVLVPDAGVLFAGDLLENPAPPYFGDGYPLDWPDTAAATLALVTGRVAPGHGEVADRGFVEGALDEFRLVASLGRAVGAGELSLEAAVGKGPYGVEGSREPIERAAAQARGELG